MGEVRHWRQGGSSACCGHHARVDLSSCIFKSRYRCYEYTRFNINIHRYIQSGQRKTALGILLTFYIFFFNSFCLDILTIKIVWFSFCQLVKWPPASWKRYSWDHLWNIGNLFRDINYATLIKYLCQDRQSSSRMFVTSRYRRVLWMHYLENGYRFLFIYRARSPLRLYLMYTTSKRILSNRRYMHIIT